MSSPLIIFTPFSSMELLYSCAFGVFTFCMLFPPLEFISAGITLENLFTYFLGSENALFFEYHIRRTSLIRVTRSSLVLLYMASMRALSDDVAKAAPNFYPPFTIWDLILWLGIGWFTITCAHTYICWYDNGTWSGHPAIRTLKKLASDERGANAFSHELVAAYIASINDECRRPDKFVSGQGSLLNNWSGRRFIVTESWILVSRFSKFQIIRQSTDQILAVLTSCTSVFDPSSLTEGGQPAGENLGTQTMISIRFSDVNSGAVILTTCSPASNLDELRIKLRCPLLPARGVELQPTIVQLFIDEFVRVVDENEPTTISKNLELDHCIGCMTQLSNVVLSQRCERSRARGDMEEDGPLHGVTCGQCRCRPMWCMECMARWFASRQTEAHRPPSQWLAGRVPCPTCRAVFCVRDVTRLV